MASYRNIYQFSIVSQNGDDVDIFILKKNYAGVVQQRPLGRAPILKRERNGNVLGTSLEIFAECRVDGEFAQLYTSSADEFLVEVYRNQVLQWSGFVSPELYSEPDIAPPYDVQIIATDGLGELRETTFSRAGRTSLQAHLTEILSHTGLAMPVSLVSSLQWDDQQIGHSAGNLLVETGVDLSHRIGDTCYDVLQDILASLNACITLQGGQWMIIRESDLYDNAEELNPALFGSMALTQWWPIGNMSTDIIPAKKRLTLIQENVYKENMLTPIKTGIVGGWDMSTGVYYDGLEDGFNVPPAGYVSNTIDFRLYPLSTQVALTIRARAIMPGARVERSVYMIYCEMQGRVAGVPGTYSLYPVSMAADSDRQEMKWHEGTEAPFFHSWPTPEEQIGEPVIEEFTFVVPLSADEGTSADRLTFRVQNVRNDGIPDYQICVYDMALAADRQIPGVKINADIANDAREAMADVDVILATSSDTSLSETMYGQLMGDEGIVKLYTPANSASDLLRFLVRDYAMQVALPRMRYRGKLNVPSMAEPVIPIIFERDSTYYFLNTYSYDLLHDELEVELVSIPNASVTIESETVTELPSTGSASGSGSGSSGGGGTSGGGGGGSSTLAGLSDVKVGAAQNGQALVYENGYWVPRTVSGGGALTSDAIISALGYTPFDSDAFTKANIKNALGIKDWALASSKPSYTFAEITSKPTTLSGYGITDAVPTWDGVFHSLQMNAIDSYRQVGYGSIANGWKTNGPAIAFGISGYTLRIQAEMALTDNPAIYASLQHNSTAYGWVRLLTDANAYTKAGADAKFLQQAGGTITGDVIVNTKLTSTVIEALQFKADGKLIMHRNAGAEGAYINYGGRTEWLRIYGSEINYYIGDETILAMDKSKNVSMAYSLSVGRDLTIGGEMLGGVPSGATYPRFRVFSHPNGLFFQAATYDGTSTAGKIGFAGYAGETAEDIYFNANTIRLLGKTTVSGACHITGDASFAQTIYATGNITTAGELNAKNYMIGQYLPSAPLDSFATAIFGKSDSDVCKMRLQQSTVAIDGVASQYSPVLAVKTFSSHGFISFGYNNANKDKCYIGAGNGDAINWSGILFHNNMNLTPKTDNIHSLGDSSYRWKEVNAVSIKIGDATITWDASAGMLKADKGIYSIGAITAGGKGQSNKYRLDEWTEWDASDNKWLESSLSAKLGFELHSRLLVIEESANLGSVTIDLEYILGTPTLTPLQARAAGLTEDVINNLLSGKYTKVISSNALEVWGYTGYSSGSGISLYFTRGDGFIVQSGLKISRASINNDWIVNYNEI